MALPRKERVKLIGGPYWTPPCTVGELIECEFHGVARVKGLTNAPIPWPRVVPVGKMRPGKTSFARCGDLLDAVKVESASAMAHWFGLSKFQVSKLRRECGVKTNNQGSSRLRKIMPRLTLTSEQLKKFNDLGAAAYREKHQWKPHELELLGKRTDREVGEMIGRTAKAVHGMRRKLGIPPVPKAGKGRRWTQEEDRLAWHLKPIEAAKRLFGRAPPQVRARRRALRGVPLKDGKRLIPPPWLEEIKRTPPALGNEEE